jgi:uncharacterized protein (DUF1778 family)
MATLTRRVVLRFDIAQYAVLEREASANGQSVAAFIRETVDIWLRERAT